MALAVPVARLAHQLVPATPAQHATHLLAVRQSAEVWNEPRPACMPPSYYCAGLDFSSASMVVFVELPHEVSLVRQAEDRAHRKGQAAKAVNVYFLCAQVGCAVIKPIAGTSCWVSWHCLAYCY